MTSKGRKRLASELVMKQGTVMTLSGLALGFGVAAATVRYLASSSSA
jgi:hypothetical protein